MTAQHSIRNCQAKDPSSCPYHGTENKINTAIKAEDLSGFVKVLQEEAKKPSGRFFIYDNTGHHLGEVKATTEQEAIKLWCKKPFNKLNTLIEKGELLKPKNLYAWEHENVILSDFIE